MPRAIPRSLQRVHRKHHAARGKRAWHRAKALPNWRIVRYTDDCAARALREVAMQKFVIFGWGAVLAMEE
jgi:hypothetical protein